MVVRYSATILGLIFLVSSGFGAEKFPKPDRAPAETTAAHREKIQEGLRLHDSRQFDAAIAIYSSVLAETPDDVRALYELAFTYFAKKDYQNTISVVRQAIRYKSLLLGELYSLLGNAYDDSGKADSAVDAYRAGIKVSPQTALLYFNLGLAQSRAGKHVEAKGSLQEALLRNPNHATSHFLLASTYQRLGYKIPALMALSRYLLLQPDSRRAADAIVNLNEMVLGSVKSGDKPGNLVINLALRPDSNKKNDEGDFGPTELSVSIAVAAAQMKDTKESPFSTIASAFSLLGESISDVKGKGFAVRYYGPFFSELTKEKGRTEAFVNTVWQAQPPQGATEWRIGNEGAVQAFDQWLHSYSWPNK
ncbi:MAG: tetratricopeptide repeat protein [Bryobacteraceae bacterium]